MTLEHSFPAAVDPDATVDVDDGSSESITLRSHAVDLTVPGATRLPTAALEIGLAHDTAGDADGDAGEGRAGLAHDLITGELFDAVARGQVMAAVAGRAPRATVHAGFGLAADAVSVEVDPSVAGSVRRPAPGSIEVVAGVAGLDRVMEVHDDCARSRIGTIGRSAEMWASLFAARGDDDQQQFSSDVAFHLDSTGRASGYARYARPARGAPQRAGVVHELWGESAEIERALWAHLLTLPEIPRWHAPSRPVDESLRHALDDGDGYRVTGRHDSLWVRVLDVDIALGARTYNPGARAVTIRVVDPLFSANCGTWRIDAYGSFRNQAAPDLEMTIDQLSAVFLGGTSVRELTDAGWVVAHSADAAADADVLFSSYPRPFCCP